MKKTMYYLMYCCLLVWTLPACEKGGDEGDMPNGPTFMILDAETQEDLLEGNNVYHKDTLKLVNEKGEAVDNNCYLWFYYNIITIEWQYLGGWERFKKEHPNGFDTTYYLYLHQNDIDTIRMVTIYEGLWGDPKTKFYFNNKEAPWTDNGCMVYIPKTKEEQNLVTSNK